MQVRGSFPYATDHEDVRVPLPGGTLLYARIWRPLTGDPVPALLEYGPGRLTDGTAPRDAQRHPWYAGHGYASVRVDPRGLGNSEGVPPADGDDDVADAVAVVEWLAARPWCDGRVGLFGLGRGGSTALRAAALAPEPPPALAAVVAVCASDGLDGDPDDGGFDVPVARHTALLVERAEPPDPRYAGDAWFDLWTARLEALDPRPPAPGPVQAGAPVPLDHAAVRVPVLAVGGWCDPYRDTVLRLAAHAPRDRVRGLLGPWPHRYPDRGEPPGPPIGFLQETLRWWDHHLRGAANGVMDEPPLRAWISGRAPGDEWTAEDAWPSPDVTDVTYALRGSPVLVRSPLHTGLDAGRPVPLGGDADLPPDQRAEDAQGACFDFPVPDDGPPVEILGRPLVRLALRSGAPAGHVVARLCDVAPDGASTLVTRGVLRHRGGEGGPYVCRLAAAGHAFRPGHRIRLALSSAYWPWVWPRPDAEAGFVLERAGSSLELPVRAALSVPGAPGAPGTSRTVVAFEEPEQAEPLGVNVPATLDGQRPALRVVHDVAEGAWRLEADPCSDEHGPVRVHPDGLEYGKEATETYTIDASGPLSARVGVEWRIRLHRPDELWDATVAVRSETGCDSGSFLTSTEVVCGVGDEVVFHRTWEKRLPRP
ncbi:CocE/NonD family hydrolase [Streptomyces coeruleoprunus]|uniref:CocE/NonD family hydrolase n=1 Tax=Streptomyces coeruleoprunus TaxID=285563 RepID=A0ABV9XJD7_9ACTN